MEKFQNQLSCIELTKKLDFIFFSAKFVIIKIMKNEN